MSRSATELLLSKTYEKVWKRGEEYANGKRVRMARSDKDGVEAVVRGTDRYAVSLKFSGGGMAKRCTCPYAEGGTSRRAPCKHMVAVAILWDEARGIPRPTREAVESETVAPPLVSRAEINAMYSDPLHANLETLRLAAESAGTWSRPHSRLPQMPRIGTEAEAPLTVAEAAKAFREIERWANRGSYDEYFCAGEVVAAFCEVMRVVARRLAATPPLVAAEILRLAQEFHYRLILELIDDSDGLHEFTGAHLDAVYQALKASARRGAGDAALSEKLNEFAEHRDDY